jgi:hypothetical protein
MQIFYIDTTSTDFHDLVVYLKFCLLRFSALSTTMDLNEGKPCELQQLSRL